jgi:nucleotide-binding universal stress UspA family protein
VHGFPVFGDPVFGDPVFGDRGFPFAAIGISISQSCRGSPAFYRKSPRLQSIPAPGFGEYPRASFATPDVGVGWCIINNERGLVLSMSSSKTIVLGTDFRLASEDALKTAAYLAQSVHGTIRVLHVIESGGAAANSAAYRLQLGQELLKQVQHHAPTRIVETARREHVDLLVMGHSSHNALYRFMLGGTTRRVLRNLPCSIMTVGAPSS